MFNVNLRVNDDYAKHKRAFIVDNFYHDPMAVRNFGLQQTYIKAGSASILSVRELRSSFFSLVSKRLSRKSLISKLPSGKNME